MSSTYVNEQILILDLKQQQANRVPKFIQNDSALLRMELYDDGVKYDIKDADNYIVSIKRSDGVTVSGRAELNGDYVEYRLTKQDLDVVGETQARLQIYKGRDRISSLAFRYDVQEDYETVGGAEELTLLTSLLIDVNDALQEAQRQGGYAESRGDYANSAGNYATDAGDSQKMNWLPYVETIEERDSSYPNPKNGDVVYVVRLDTEDPSGGVFRYDSIKTPAGWVQISGYTTSIIQDIYTMLNTKVNTTEFNTQLNAVRDRLTQLEEDVPDLESTLTDLIESTEVALRQHVQSVKSGLDNSISTLSTSVTNLQNNKLNKSEFDTYKTTVNNRFQSVEGSISGAVNDELAKKVNKTHVKRDINSSSESVMIEGSNLDVGTSEFAEGLKDGSEQISVNSLSDEGVYKDENGILTLDHANIRRPRGGYSIYNGELTIAPTAEFYRPVFGASQAKHTNGRVWNESGVFYSAPLPAIFGQNFYSPWGSLSQFNGYRDARNSLGLAMVEAFRIVPTKRYIRITYGVDTTEAGAIVRVARSGGDVHGTRQHPQGNGVSTHSIVLDLETHTSSSNTSVLFYMYAAPPSTDVSLSNSHNRRCRVRLLHVVQTDTTTGADDLNLITDEELQNFTKELEDGQIVNPTPPPKPPVPSTTTKTYSANAAGNYSYKFRNWDPSYAPDTPFQGVWDIHGQKEGAWFFGSAMRNELQGKTITKVEVSLGRSSHLNGYSGKRPFYLRLHPNATKPSTNSGPLSFSNAVFTGELDIGETRWFDVTNTFSSLLSNGSWYGFGVKTTSTSPRVYMVFNSAMQVRVTYRT